MFATLTVRWLLIYFCIIMAAWPLLAQSEISARHFFYAGLALMLVYFAPRVSSKEK